MKKHLLLSLLAVIGYGFNNNVAAQCSADPQYTQIGVWPQVLPQSCINTPYDETITLIYPNDTCVALGGGTCTTFSLADATITNVANLPNGITYSCPNQGCVYTPVGGLGKNTASCFQVFGTPTVSGTFTVTVTVSLRTAVAGSFAVDYDFDVTINDVGVGNCVTTGINTPNTTNTLTVSPNPTNRTAQLSKNVQSGVLKNTEGITVLTLKNTDFIDLSSLSSGLYFLVTEEETLKIVKE